MPVVADIPDPVSRAAAVFGLETARLRRLGGHSGGAWGAGDGVLRIGRRPRMVTELAATTAAAAAVSRCVSQSAHCRRPAHLIV
jgi:hypothetical protein